LLSGTQAGLQDLDMPAYSARILAGWRKTEEIEGGI
jgi:hypothetical protein